MLWHNSNPEHLGIIKSIRIMSGLCSRARPRACSCSPVSTISYKSDNRMRKRPRIDSSSSIIRIFGKWPLPFPSFVDAIAWQSFRASRDTGIKRLADFARQAVSRERLGQEEASRLDGALLADALAGIPGHVHDHHFGAFVSQFLRERPAADAGHYDIGEQQMDGCLISFAYGQSLHTIVDNQYRVAAKLQSVAHQAAQRRFVFRYQHGLGSLN